MSDLNGPAKCGFWQIQYMIIFVQADTNNVKRVEMKSWGASPVGVDIWLYAEDRAKKLAFLDNGQPLKVKSIHKRVIVDCGELLRDGSLISKPWPEEVEEIPFFHRAEMVPVPKVEVSSGLQ